MFERVAIVGVGLIGGSLGLALRGRGMAREVVGIGRSEASLERAVTHGAITRYTTDLRYGIREADLVVLATPISRILSDLERLNDGLSPECVVTDVGSTKSDIARAGDEAVPGGRFVPGHPMAGSEKSGVDAARADLFNGATWALTATEMTNPEALGRVRDMAVGVGAHVREFSPEAHDRAVAVTSHLPHVLAYALAAVAGGRVAEEPQLFDLAAGSFASGTRVAHSDPDLWVEIALANRKALAEAVRESRAQLDHALAALDQGDTDALRGAFRRGWDAVRSLRA